MATRSPACPPPRPARPSEPRLPAVLPPRPRELRAVAAQPGLRASPPPQPPRPAETSRPSRLSLLSYEVAPRPPPAATPPTQASRFLVCVLKVAGPWNSVPHRASDFFLPAGFLPPSPLFSLLLRVQQKTLHLILGLFSPESCSPVHWSIDPATPRPPTPPPPPYTLTGTFDLMHPDVNSSPLPQPALSPVSLSALLSPRGDRTSGLPRTGWAVLKPTGGVLNGHVRSPTPNTD